jgi:hypothetical protein
LGGISQGLAGLALADLLSPQRTEGSAVLSDDSGLEVGCHFPPKVKRVIFVFMHGGPSHIDTFDYKPELIRLHGQPLPIAKPRIQFAQTGNLLKSPWEFKQYGESGAWVSDLFPNVAKHVDRLTFIKSLHGSNEAHGGALLKIHTGSDTFVRPSLGAWISYGLGTQNANLPSFVTINPTLGHGGVRNFGSAFLPPNHQGTRIAVSGKEAKLENLVPRNGDPLQRLELDYVRDMERFGAAGSMLGAIEAKEKTFELAYRMQVSVPEVMDLGSETQATLDLYGAKPGFVSQAESETDPRVFYRGDDPTMANNCLLARRLVESGVRFVQLFDWGWDHHGSSPGESLDETLPIKCQQLDKAVSGLLTDLKQRGLLESTLVVVGGEFGRTPMSQNIVRDTPSKGFFGRDHHPYAYSMLLAGGGVRGGLSYGQSDEIGYYVAEDPVTPKDLQATLLHLLGLDPYRFGYEYQGLFNRLIGPTDEGKILTRLVV